ncbi:MAG: GDP-mannose 4,6-dehydratase, partial [Planctomycetota bacterium]
MKVLVTGGAGFIGSNFIEWLLADQPQLELLNVDALTYAGNPANLKGVADQPRYHFLRADIADREAMDRAFGDFCP